MQAQPFYEQTIKGELDGKHAAIHGYDKIIWTIRSGYLTLVFVGWSILLKAFAENTVPPSNKLWLALCMYLITLFLSAGGLAVDNNYVKRKFRVIAGLNSFLGYIRKARGDVSLIPDEDLAKVLKISGDDGTTSYEGPGYDKARNAGLIVYVCPSLVLALVMLIVTSLM